MIQPTPHDWASAIARRISDEWSGSKEYPDDAALLRDVLTEALGSVPEACAKLIGTGVIEEGYFEPLR